MEIQPNRDDLARHPNKLMWTVVSIAALVFLLVLSAIGFLFVPTLVDGTIGGIVNYLTMDDLSTFLIISDAFDLRFLPHSYPIVKLTDIAETRPLVSSDLDSLAGMQDVLDAFYIDYDQGNGFVINQTVPVAKLQEQLDPNGIGKQKELTKLRLGGCGLRHLSTDNGEYLLLIRYTKKHAPEQAKGVVGVVMDERKIIAGLPGILDSLLTNSSYFDVNRPTLGLLEGSDTLWWHSVRITDKDLNPAKGEYEGIAENIYGLNITLLVKTEIPANLYVRGKDGIFQQIPVNWFHALPIIVLSLEFLLVAALIALVLQIRKASRRKKAA